MGDVWLRVLGQRREADGAPRSGAWPNTDVAVGLPGFIHGSCHIHVRWALR